MNDKNYTPPARTSQSEGTVRANGIRADINPSKVKGFSREYGEFRPGGNPAGYWSCFCLGHEVKLRFDQVWTAYCPDLNLETTFTNRTDDDKIVFLSDWINDLLDNPQAPTAQHRQRLPSVLYLAEYHDIPVHLADEIMRGR